MRTKGKTSWIKDLWEVSRYSKNSQLRIKFPFGNIVFGYTKDNNFEEVEKVVDEIISMKEKNEELKEMLSLMWGFYGAETTLSTENYNRIKKEVESWKK